MSFPLPTAQALPPPPEQCSTQPQDFWFAPNARAFFLFVTEDGTISGWNPTISPNAVLIKNNAGKAFYKGCTIAQTAGGRAFFYATNFLTGRGETYDANFHRINPGDDGGFRLPGLSKNWSPFNIQNIGGSLVVTFAHRAPGSLDEDHGAGLGHVGVFDPNSHLLMQLKDGPWFNAPWGVALAPGDFGKFTHRLLIGNFGDGTIQGFNAFTGLHEGAMINDTTGQTLSIEGLWALSFGGDSTNNGTATTLFFSSGPNDENDGIFGQLTAVSSEQPGNTQ